METYSLYKLYVEPKHIETIDLCDDDEDEKEDHLLVEMCDNKDNLLVQIDENQDNSKQIQHDFKVSGMFLNYNNTI